MFSIQRLTTGILVSDTINTGMWHSFHHCILLCLYINDAIAYLIPFISILLVKNIQGKYIKFGFDQCFVALLDCCSFHALLFPIHLNHLLTALVHAHFSKVWHQWQICSWSDVFKVCSTFFYRILVDLRRGLPISKSAKTVLCQE